MVVRMRHTKSARNQRRSHHAISAALSSRCTHCGKDVRPHTVCAHCGYYKERQVVDVLAKLDKKERKKREKEMAEEAEHTHPPIEAKAS
jgi:large subunit ribosomal protein L32